MSSLLKQVQDRATNMIGAGALHLRGDVQGKGLAQPWEEKASGWFNISLPTPARTYEGTREGEMSFLLEVHGAGWEIMSTNRKDGHRHNENLFLQGAQSWIKPGCPERLCSLRPLWDWTGRVPGSDSIADPALSRGLNYRHVPKVS